MVADDFYFAGHYLSEFGFIIVQFDSDNGGFADDVAGSTMTLTQLPIDGGKYNPLVSTKYESVFTTSIGICKPDGTEVTADEYNELMLWLLRKDFAEFSIVNSDLEDVIFNGTFNAERRLHKGKTIGFVLTFTADAPFGHNREVTKTLSFAGGDSQSYNVSIVYEPGYFYPDTITLTIGASGNLEMTNSRETGRTTTIKNCQSGEVITMNGRLRLITSSIASHDILADFNYCFPRLLIDYDNQKNTFTSNLKCDMEFKYKPMVKVVV